MWSAWTEKKNARIKYTVAIEDLFYIFSYSCCFIQFRFAVWKVFCCFHLFFYFSFSIAFTTDHELTRIFTHRKIEITKILMAFDPLLCQARTKWSARWNAKNYNLVFPLTQTITHENFFFLLSLHIVFFLFFFYFSSQTKCLKISK